MKTNPARTLAAVAVLVLLLAFGVSALALERGGDVLMIGLGLVLAATSMELFRRAHPPAP
jgi:hypothetical protein